MNLPNYATFTEKDEIFAREQIDAIDALMDRMETLAAEGYYFRGQIDSGWKLYSKIQREWMLKDLHGTFSSAEMFNEQHLRHQQMHAATELNCHTKQRNDLADSSALQHYGAPSPFLDFTSKIEAALFFATDGIGAANERETSQRFSIYAWKPGEGPATASHNDLMNWEQVVDNSGGIACAVSLNDLNRLSVIYIKQDSGKFLQIANNRVDLQNGLFVYSPKAVREGLPYEEIFTGHNSSRVLSTHDEINPQCEEASSDQPEVNALFQMCGNMLSDFDPNLFIPKMICLDVDKAVAPEIIAHLKNQGVCAATLGLESEDWASPHYHSLLKSLAPDP
jgi:hypothetical protein